MQSLEPPMERALELGWESFRAGSLGVGATVSRFRGIERVRDLNEFLARRWPEIVEVRVDEWAAFSLLLYTHFVTFWGMTLDGWAEALPSIAGLAQDLVDRGELIHLAAEAVPLSAAATALGDRLSACVPDVERIAAGLPT